MASLNSASTTFTSAWSSSTSNHRSMAALKSRTDSHSISQWAFMHQANHKT